MSKLKHKKTEIKSSFFPGSHCPKELLQGPGIFKSDMYMDNEMMDYIKKAYLNTQEINFIDEIMFSDVNRLSNSILI